VDWIKFILKPSLGLGIQKSNQSKFTLYVAISYDVIWRRSNEVVHNADPEGLTDPRQIADQIQKSYLTIVRHGTSRFLTEADCLGGLPLLHQTLNSTLMQLLVRVLMVWLWFAGII
jgi:hypothetical protein